jgi:hypothetical protein
MPTIMVLVLAGGGLRSFADGPPLPAVAAGVGTGFRYDGMRGSLKSRQSPDEAAA